MDRGMLALVLCALLAWPAPARDERSAEEQALDEASANLLFTRQTRDQNVRRASIEVLVRGLRSGEVRVRRIAIRYLLEEVAADEMPAEAVTDLTRLLKDSDAEVRVGACGLLLGIDAEGQARAASAVLLPAVRDPDAQVRADALGFLGALPRPGPEVIDAATRALRDESGLVRTAGVNLLGQLGEKGLPALADLRKVLREDGDAEVRRAAVQVVAWRAADDRETLPALMRSIREDADESVRAAAIEGLGQLGEKAEPATEAVLAALEKDPSNWVRLTAATQAFRMSADDSRLARGLVELLRDEKTGDRALDELRWLGGRARPGVARLAELLKESSPKVKRWALQALGMIGPQAREAVAAVSRCLGDDHPGVRMTAAAVLWQIDGQLEKPLAFLCDGLRSDRADEAQEALDALAILGRHGRPLLDDVTPLLRRDRGFGPFFAARALAAMGRPGIEAAAKVIGDPAIKTRDAIVSGIRQAGPVLRFAVPELKRALRSSDREVRSRALTLLGDRGPGAADAAAELCTLVADRDTPNYDAAETLTKLGEAARPAVPDLVRLFEEATDQYDRWRLAAGLARLGPVAKAAVPRLRGLLQNEDPGVRKLSAVALGGMGREVRPAVPDLLERLQDRDDGVRAAAATALGQATDVAPDVVPGLRRALRDPQDAVRAAAAAALGRFGRLPRSTAEDLWELLKDPVPQVRHAAAAALWQVDGDARRLTPVLLEGAIAEVNNPYHHLPETPQPCMSALSAGGLPLAREALVDALNVKDPEVRVMALRVLSTVTDLDGGLRSRALNRALKDADFQVRLAALDLAPPGRPSAELLGVLRQALEARDAETPRRAADFLRRLGSDAAGAADDLKQRLKDRDGLVRVRAAEALARLDKPTEEVIAVLRRSLTCPGDPGRAEAARALGTLARGAAVAAELRDALRDPDQGVRLRAAEALWRVAGEDARAEAAAELIHLAQAGGWAELRAEAVAILGRLGDAAVTPTLREALMDPDPLVRRSAAAALERR
jgi:HEAT repeat protein